MAELFDFDIVAANNNDAPPNGWPEFMEYEEVNDSARELMAVLARFYAASLSGTKLTTGTQPAYELISGQTFSGYEVGQLFAFAAHATSTGNVTLDVDGKGAGAVTDSVGNQLGLGDIRAGGIYFVSRTASAFKVIGHLAGASLAAAAGVTLLRSFVTAGTSNAFTVNTGGLFTAYSNDQLICVRPDRANTGAATINIDGLGAEPWVDFAGAALASGDIGTGEVCILVRVSGSWRTIAGIPIDLAAQVSGTLPVANGGTNRTTTAAYAADIAQFGPGFGAATNLASASTADLGTIATHNVVLTGTTTINSFGSSANVLQPVYRVTAATGPITIVNSANIILPANTGRIDFRAGDSFVALYQGSGVWRIVDVVFAQFVWNAGYVNGLSITNNAGTPNTQIDVSLASAVMITAFGYPYSAGAQFFTINAATTGANGLDTGALAANTWYYVWIIATGNSTAGLLSLSSSSPTMPSGYGYMLRVGAVRTNGSSQFLRTFQKGRETQYRVIGGSTTPNLPVIGTGVAGSPTVPTWVAISLAGIVPPTATRVKGGISMVNSTSNITAAPNNQHGGVGSLTNPPPVFLSVRGGTPFDFFLETQEVFWASNDSTGIIWVQGWTDSVPA